MKKTIRIFLVLSLALSLSSAMVGCGSSSTTQNTASQSGTQTDTSGQAVSGETAPEQNSQSKDPEYTLGKIVSSGSCGSSVTYELDENGLLVISGSGDMGIYQGITDCPWHAQRENIKTVIIKNGVTSIGNGAFYACKSLTAITIPDSVTSIGDYAFLGCKGLADEKGFVIVRNVLYDYVGKDVNVTIPDSVTSIGSYAFSGCTSLTAITIPDSVTSIGDYAFYECTSLTAITIPNSVTSIGNGAFYECTGLTISGKSGSYAETYAKENKIPFRAV